MVVLPNIEGYMDDEGHWWPDPRKAFLSAWEQHIAEEKEKSKRSKGCWMEKYVDRQMAAVRSDMSAVAKDVSKTASQLSAVEGKLEALSCMEQSSLSSLSNDIKKIAVQIQRQKAETDMRLALFNARLEAVENIVPKIFSQTLNVEVRNQKLSVDVCDIHHGLGLI